MKKIKLPDATFKYVGRDVTVYFDPKRKIGRIVSMHKPFKCTKSQASYISDDIENLRNIDVIKTKRLNPREVKKIRENLYYNNGIKCCFICDGFMNFSETTLEHIIPLSLGGGNRYENYSLSHYLCNVNKGDSL